MAITASDHDNGPRRKLKDLGRQHERLCNAMRKEAEKLGRQQSDARCVTINYRDANETREEALRLFIEAHGDERAIYVGVDVSGSAPGSIHSRDPHIHLGTFVPKSRLWHILKSETARNETAPGSYRIKPPKDIEGGFVGWCHFPESTSANCQSRLQEACDVR